MFDLAGRLANRAQLSTDGFGAYLKAVGDAFAADVDHARLAKLFGDPPGVEGHEREYSPSECSGIIKEPVFGRPDPAHVGTSHAERQNLMMRMRRFARLASAFSKKVENRVHAVALHVMHYNFVRTHKTLTMPPAMAAGLTTRAWEIEDIVALVETAEEPPRKRGPYKPRQLHHSN